MKVALGTYEVTEEERKAIKKAMGFKGGKASRDDARDFILAAVADAVDRASQPDPEEAIAAAEAEEENA